MAGEDEDTAASNRVTPFRVHWVMSQPTEHLVLHWIQQAFPRHLCLTAKLFFASASKIRFDLALTSSSTSHTILRYICVLMKAFAHCPACLQYFSPLLLQVPGAKHEPLCKSMTSNTFAEKQVFVRGAGRQTVRSGCGLDSGTPGLDLPVSLRLAVNRPVVCSPYRKLMSTCSRAGGGTPFLSQTSLGGPDLLPCPGLTQVVTAAMG
ncbi:hypothetical protein TREES_T100010991 [Tupaia chinensis]|uniref:Uncharacterized protein n=1 Tax=Tupaia chinensis TaxID=246437 RepID=L9JEB4_TUPCH|nr:hypothetical protein TREES_T100010991 [Tupaia chinensis]